MKRTSNLLAIGCVCACTALIGCGGDDKPASSSGTEAPESRIASDAAVAVGLKALAGVATGIAKIPSSEAAKKASKGLEPVWQKVEGTVKKNEPDMYATIEEDLALLESGEQSKTEQGAQEMSDTVDAYLAKHPG